MKLGAGIGLAALGLLLAGCHGESAAPSDKAFFDSMSKAQQQGQTAPPKGGGMRGFTPGGGAGDKPPSATK